MKTNTESATEDEDRIHPRFTYGLFGHGAAIARAAQALRRGRPPQGWLISGPPGIGKATLAYRIARYVLTYGPTGDGPGDLDVPAESEAARLIDARAHPGLRVITRTLDQRGKLRSELTVDAIRGLAHFFGMTSASGGWRVAIIDCADDMNDHAANALLKLLEEPPKRALLLLIAHAPGRLLPTIRSRCQRLDLRPLGTNEMAAALDMLAPELKGADRDLILELAEGAPGIARRLCEGKGLELAREAENLVAARDAPDFPALLAMAERIAKAEDGLAEFGNVLSRALSRRIRQRAYAAGKGCDRWVEVLGQIDNLFSRAVGVHLEPRQTVLSAARLVGAGRRYGGRL